MDFIIYELYLNTNTHKQSNPFAIDYIHEISMISKVRKHIDTISKRKKTLSSWLKKIKIYLSVKKKKMF